MAVAAENVDGPWFGHLQHLLLLLNKLHQMWENEQFLLLMDSLGQVYGKRLVQMACPCSMNEARGYLGEAEAGIIPRLICSHVWLLGWEDLHQDSQLQY